VTYPDYVLDESFTLAVRRAIGVDTVADNMREAELSIGGKAIGVVTQVAFQPETVYGSPVTEYDGPCDRDGCEATGKHWHLANG
jgi:hypothetical protein